MPCEPKTPAMVKQMKKGEMFKHISELYNVIDLTRKEEVKWRKDALHFRTAHNMFIELKTHPVLNVTNTICFLSLRILDAKGLLLARRGVQDDVWPHYPP